MRLILRLVGAAILAASIAGSAAARGPNPGAAAAPPAEPSTGTVSGTLIVDGKAFPLAHAYLDVTDPEEPIVVLSDVALPKEAVPFIPEKLVKEKHVHAVAFSISRKTGALTNTFGKVYAPEHELGVGLGRVEDGNTKWTATRVEPALVQGRFATPKPVTLSDISYSFDLTFRAAAGKPTH